MFMLVIKLNFFFTRNSTLREARRPYLKATFINSFFFFKKKKAPVINYNIENNFKIFL